MNKVLSNHNIPLISSMKSGTGGAHAPSTPVADHVLSAHWCTCSIPILVTIHGKTNHIAHKIVFEIRRALPSMAFELLLEKI